MRIPVLIEPAARNRYRARAIGTFVGTVTGSTREEALVKMRAKIEDRLKNGAELVELEVSPPSNPWMEFAGMFKDDPWIEDWKRSIEEYRRQVDEDPDVL